MRGREQEQFWLQINHANASVDSLILFDTEEFVILRHVLRDERGEHLLDVHYADHQPLSGKAGKYTGSDPEAIIESNAQKDLCRIPASITLSSNANANKIELKLSSFIDDALFSAEDFHLEIPDNFKQILVK